MSYRLRHAFILLLLLGMAGSNLSPVLGDAAGLPFKALGLRQYWSMFAPNTVHDARFVDAAHIAPDGTRTLLGISAEPPAEGFFFAWGYDRIHKLHKQVARKPDRYAQPYAAALCRLHGLQGAVELLAVHRVAPPPDRAREGARPTRTVTTLGSWPCP